MAKANREELLGQLECVTPGLSEKEIIEQSDCFVFTEKYVQTFNDEIACRHSCRLGITGAVKADPLLQLLRKMPEDEIDIEVGEGELLVTGRKRKRRAGIRMESEVLLPVGSVEKPDTWHKLPEDFNEAVGIVQHCAGKDESQFAMTCIHLHPKWIEASDGLQISRYRMRIGLKEETLVRRDSIKHVTNLGMTKFSETTTWLHFKNPNGLVLSCRRFTEDMSFPNFSKLLKTEGHRMTLPKGLKEAAEMAAIFSSQNADDNLVLVEMRPGKLRITGQGAGGWYKEPKKLQDYEGDPIAFTIPPELLQSLVALYNEVEITEDKLKVNGGKFTYLTSLGDAGDDT